MNNRPYVIPEFEVVCEHCNSVIGYKQIERGKYRLAFHDDYYYIAKGDKSARFPYMEVAFVDANIDDLIRVAEQIWAAGMPEWRKCGAPVDPIE